MKKIKQILGLGLLCIGLWALVIVMAYALHTTTRTDYLGDISLQEHFYTFCFGTGVICMISFLHASPKFPPLLDNRWFLFHLIFSIFAYIVYQNIFFEVIMLDDLNSAIFLKKEAAFGTTIMDKILGNGFAVYAIVLTIQTLLLKNREEMSKHSKSFSPTVYKTQIKVKKGQKIYFIETASIDYIKASNNYIDIFANGKKHVVRESLSNLEGLLNPTSFLRIHRSSIVGISFVDAFISLGNGNYSVKLKDGYTLKVGNTYKEKVLQQFGVMMN